MIIDDPAGLTMVTRDHPQIEVCPTIYHCDAEIRYMDYLEVCDLYDGHQGWHVMYREPCAEGHAPVYDELVCVEGHEVPEEVSWDRMVPALAWGVG